MIAQLISKLPFNTNQILWYYNGTLSLAGHFFALLPFPVLLLLQISMYMGLVGIISAHGYAIWKSRKTWKEKKNSKLMYSYFCGSGKLQHRFIYNEVYRLLRNKTWFPISFAYWTKRLGDITINSKFLTILLAVFYIPLSIISTVEMLVRRVVGLLYFLVVSFVHWAILTIISIISHLLIPFWKIIDRSMRVNQHCPHCYRTFRLPVYICPKCRTYHFDLVPGETGILYARCECGKFLPAMELTGRNKLDAVCPECNKVLAASNSKDFSIQLIGGNSSGKSAYLAAFQHIYLSRIIQGKSPAIHLAPKNAFAELETMYKTGKTQESSKTSATTYTIVHVNRDGSKDSLVFYDMPDEVLMTEIYEQSPLNFAYTDAILFVIDPTSANSIRLTCIRNGEIPADETRTEDDAEDVIAAFIDQFSRMTNRNSSQMIGTPVAVLINKCDLATIKKQIGKANVRLQYMKQPEIYNYSLEQAQSNISREFLIKSGFHNLINIIESVFSEVKYFPVSSIGHSYIPNKAFTPDSIIEPIAWVLNQSNSRIAQHVNLVLRDPTGREHISRTSLKSLDEKYDSAIRLLRDNRFSEAKGILISLGNYRETHDLLQIITEQQYRYAVSLFDKRQFGKAAKEFKELGEYKDSKAMTVESTYLRADVLLSNGKYETAIKMFTSLGGYRDSKIRCSEARYRYGGQLTAQGDAISARKQYLKIYNYKDVFEKLKQLTPELIKQGVTDGLILGNTTWRVLEKKDDSFALLITEKPIGKMPFNQETGDCSWATSDIRRYLNGNYLDNFTETERKLIFPTEIETPPNAEYSVDGCGYTVDSIFLLSAFEAYQFFDSDEARKMVSQDPIWMWLRSPGASRRHVMIIDANGRIDTKGIKCINPAGSVRPALWINLLE